MALEITKENYSEVMSSSLPVVIDFWAEWCGPCRAIAPIVEELASEYEGRIIVAKCDVEENDDIVSKYGVRNIPTIVMLKGGELVDKQVGAATKSALKEKLEALLG
ncbi:MAG: thioredoxin [Rikenellaceae bacterium]